jgi:hypothetical protein
MFTGVYGNIDIFFYMANWYVLCLYGFNFHVSSPVLKSSQEYFVPVDSSVCCPLLIMDVHSLGLARGNNSTGTPSQIGGANATVTGKPPQTVITSAASRSLLSMQNKFRLVSLIGAVAVFLHA